MLVTERNVAARLERLDRAEWITLDTETNGLDIWSGDRMIGVAAKVGGEADYFPFRHGEGENLSETRRRQLVKAVSGKKLRGFHLRFDCEVMHNEGMTQPTAMEDTLIAALLMNENEPCFALKRNKRGQLGLAPKYLGRETIAADDRLAELMQTHGIGKGDMAQLDPKDVAEYACADLDLPDRLLEEVYRPALATWGMTGLYQEYNDYQRLLTSMEIGGLPINRSIVESALAEGETGRAALLDEIHRAAGYPLNPNSAPQVRTWLGTTDAREETVMASKHPQAESLIDYKAYIKRDNTYLKKYRDLADPLGFLHVQLNLTSNDDGVGGTRSARLSASRPNLQAMPKPKTNTIYAACRRAIEAPPGFSVMEADYAQAEVRIAGHYTQEPALFAAFNDGLDLYLDMAQALSITRQEAKILFLAIQYGAGVWKIAEMLGISEEAARRLRAKWHAKYPRIKRLMYKLADMAEEKHCIRLWSGRWGHFDGPTKSVTCKSPYYTAWNRLVQGSVAEIVRHAMMRLRDPIDHLGGRMLLQVHDSILFLVPTAQRHVAAALIRREMEDFLKWEIAPKVDIKIGPNWLDVTDYKGAA